MFLPGGIGIGIGIGFDIPPGGIAGQCSAVPLPGGSENTNWSLFD